MAVTGTALEVISIYPESDDLMRVQWSIDVSQSGPGPFTYSVFNSGSQEGPWTQIASGLVDEFVYNDTTPLVHGQNKDVFYRVEAEPGGHRSHPRSAYRNIPKDKRLIIRKIISDEQVMLRKGNGGVAYIVRKKHFGARCTSCYDPKTRSTLKSRCGTCAGTGFLVGYYNPIKTMAKILPSQPGSNVGARDGEPEITTASCMLQAFPLVVRGDFLVEPEINKRWEITSWQPTEILRNVVHQDITLSEISTAHEIYGVEVPLGI